MSHKLKTAALLLAAALMPARAPAAWAGGGQGAAQFQTTQPVQPSPNDDDKPYDLEAHHPYAPVALPAGVDPDHAADYLNGVEYSRVKAINDTATSFREAEIRRQKALKDQQAQQALRDRKKKEARRGPPKKGKRVQPRTVKNPAPTPVHPPTAPPQSPATPSIPPMSPETGSANQSFPPPVAPSAPQVAAAPVTPITNQPLPTIDASAAFKSELSSYFPGTYRFNSVGSDPTDQAALRKHVDDLRLKLKQIIANVFDTPDASAYCQLNRATPDPLSLPYAYFGEPGKMTIVFVEGEAMKTFQIPRTSGLSRALAAYNECTRAAAGAGAGTTDASANDSCAQQLEAAKSELSQWKSATSLFREKGFFNAGDNLYIKADPNAMVAAVAASSAGGQVKCTEPPSPAGIAEGPGSPKTVAPPTVPAAPQPPSTHDKPAVSLGDFDIFDDP